MTIVSTIIHVSTSRGGGAQHRGNILASHPAALGSNPSSTKIDFFSFNAEFVDSNEIEPI